MLSVLCLARQNLYCVFQDKAAYRQYNQMVFKGINDFCQNKDYRMVSFSYSDKKDIRDRTYKIKDNNAGIIFVGPWLKSESEWLYRYRGNRFNDILLFDSSCDVKDISTLKINREDLGILLGISTLIFPSPYLFIQNRDLSYLDDIRIGIEKSFKQKGNILPTTYINTDILNTKNTHKYLQRIIGDANTIIIATGPVNKLSAWAGEILNKKVILHGNISFSERKYPSLMVHSSIDLTSAVVAFLERCLYRKKGIDLEISIRTEHFEIDRSRLTTSQRIRILEESL